MTSSSTKEYDENSIASKFAKSKYFGEMRPLIHEFSVKMMIERLEKFLPVPIKNVLDVGCGEGYMTRMLVRSGIVQSATGIDISKDLIQLAQNAVQEHEKEHFQYYLTSIEDFKTTAKTTEKFPLVLSTAVLCHMTTKEQLYQMLREIRQLCTGFLVGYIPNPFYDLLNAPKLDKYGFKCFTFTSLMDEEKYFATFDANTDNPFTLSGIWYTPETYENMFRKAGFATFEWIPMKTDPTASADRQEHFADACHISMGFIAGV